MGLRRESDNGRKARQSRRGRRRQSETAAEACPVVVAGRSLGRPGENKLEAFIRSEAGRIGSQCLAVPALGDGPEIEPTGRRGSAAVDLGSQLVHLLTGEPLERGGRVFGILERRTKKSKLGADDSSLDVQLDDVGPILERVSEKLLGPSEMAFVLSLQSCGLALYGGRRKFLQGKSRGGEVFEVGIVVCGGSMDAWQVAFVDETDVGRRVNDDLNSDLVSAGKAAERCGFAGRTIGSKPWLRMTNGSRSMITLPRIISVSSPMLEASVNGGPSIWVRMRVPSESVLRAASLRSAEEVTSESQSTAHTTKTIGPEARVGG